MCDWSATVANPPPSDELIETEAEFKKEVLLRGGSRWGDVDDILMFTARARDGQLFRGKMPRALMMYANINAGLSTVLPTDADWAEDIAISSEFAEIAWFTVPLNLSDAGLYEPSTYEIVLNRGQVDNFLPRRMALCRKVLLIRPDLDITPPPALRVYNNSPIERLYYVQPTSPLAESSATVAFETVNANAYQRCDLSVSTHTVLGPSGNVFLSYKTNSLSDLQDPQNRYAHGVYPLSNGSGTVLGATLPVMMLTSGINDVALLTCQNAINAIQAGANPTTVPNGGFVPPFFMRVAYRRIDPSNWRTWLPYSTLQEMITPDVLAFDLKAFDPSAPVIFHPGPDGQWGDGAPNIAARAGWFGTDDVTVDPSQPGFWQMLSLTDSPFNVPIEVERGAYVDMGWAFRSMPGTVIPSARAPMLISEFSGMSSTGVSPFLIQGGAISVPALAGHTIGTPTFIFQNAFDTFTTQYDSDGEQDLLGPELGATQRFRYSRHALNRYGYTVVSTNPLANQDPDGVDVPPPYPSELRSIQATIRVQDRTAQAIQQISIIHSLVD
jgi:hypothetical protein